MASWLFPVPVFPSIAQRSSGRSWNGVLRSAWLVLRGGLCTTDFGIFQLFEGVMNGLQGFNITGVPSCDAR